MILSELLVEVEQGIAKVSSEYAIEARILLETRLQLTRLDFVLNRNQEISSEAVAGIRNDVQRRLQFEPIQYILGEQDFMGMTFKVAPGVLIPRQDTESLVDYALDALKTLSVDESLSVLDVGTGSGAILISLLKLRDNIEGTAIDISEIALEIARENATSLGVSQRVRFIKSDLFDALNALNETDHFDLIVSNPPYIPERDRPTLQREITGYEPDLALFGGEEGLDFYYKMIPDAKCFLKSGGYLMFEAGHDQGQRIAELMREQGYQNVRCETDLRGIPRFIIGQMQ